MTKSRFKIDHLIWNVLMLVFSVAILLLLISVLNDLIDAKVGLVWILLAVFLVLVLVIVFLSLKNIKYLKINSEMNELVWYSIINPLGTKLNLEEFLGYIAIDSYSANGKTKKVYLVDAERKTGLDIDELVYSNFDEILDSINLKELKFKKGGISNYFKLLYLGGIKV